MMQKRHLKSIVLKYDLVANCSATIAVCTVQVYSAPIKSCAWSTLMSPLHVCFCTCLLTPNSSAYRECLNSYCHVCLENSTQGNNIHAVCVNGRRRVVLRIAKVTRCHAPQESDLSET